MRFTISQKILLLDISDSEVVSSCQPNEAESFNARLQETDLLSSAEREHCFSFLSRSVMLA
jgi:hypothetical protein